MDRVGRVGRPDRVGVLVAVMLGATVLHAQPPQPFRLEETTIRDVQAAFRSGSLTCRALVQQYLDRIGTFDKKGPAINAIVVINPDALAAADALDRRFRQSGPVGPQHCVPPIV
jgi:Asp-tRNA(Asn)/Glu-tRNA(Gln) amidotransferase A subunit family amidase